MSSVRDRVSAKRKAEGLSLRDVSKDVGVAFSTLARVERGDGEYSKETALRLRRWLGDDVPAIIPNELRQQAEELGRAMARACADEIMRIIREASALLPPPATP